MTTPPRPVSGSSSPNAPARGNEALTRTTTGSSVSISRREPTWQFTHPPTSPTSPPSSTNAPGKGSATTPRHSVSPKKQPPHQPAEIASQARSKCPHDTHVLHRLIESAPPSSGVSKDGSYGTEVTDRPLAFPLASLLGCRVPRDHPCLAAHPLPGVTRFPLERVPVVGRLAAPRAGLYLRLDDILELVTIGTVRHEAASLTSAKHEDFFHSRSVALADSRQLQLCSEPIGHIDVTLRAK